MLALLLAVPLLVFHGNVGLVGDVYRTVLDLPTGTKAMDAALWNEFSQGDRHHGHRHSRQVGARMITAPPNQGRGNLSTYNGSYQNGPPQPP